MFLEHQIISKGSCWSEDCWKFSFAISGINYNLKCNKLLLLIIVIIFHNNYVLSVLNSKVAHTHTHTNESIWLFNKNQPFDKSEIKSFPVWQLAPDSPISIAYIFIIIVKLSKNSFKIVLISIKSTPFFLGEGSSQQSSESCSDFSDSDTDSEAATDSASDTEAAAHTSGTEAAAQTSGKVYLRLL